MARMNNNNKTLRFTDGLDSTLLQDLMPGRAYRLIQEKMPKNQQMTEELDHKRPSKELTF